MWQQVSGNTNTSKEEKMATLAEQQAQFEGVDPEELIGSQGGSIDPFDTRGDGVPVQRWLFPRFPGADKIGTCASEAVGHEGQHTKIGKGKGKCSDFAPDMGLNYLSRSGIGGHDTDVETVAAWLEAPREIVGAVFAEGEPGTGKTALIEAAVTRLGRQMTTVVCTPDHTKDSLFLRFVGEGRGDDGSPYTLGPFPYAAKHGHALYVDEVMMLVDGVKPLLYALADGRRFLPEGNVDGSPLEIHPDFRLVMSANPQVRGASLPEPLASRTAGTTIRVETDEALLKDLWINEDIIAAWKAMKSGGMWTPQIRELRVADYWLSVSPEQALSAMVPEHCPESMRESIVSLISGFFGGNPSKDGRLIVS